MENILNINNAGRILLNVVVIIGIFFTGKSFFTFMTSTSYKITQYLNNTFINQKQDPIESFCFDNNLVEKNEDNKIILTNKGFQYMNSMNSTNIAYIALLVALISAVVSLLR